MEYRVIDHVSPKPGSRRCKTCGSKADGRACGECGETVGPRQAIGMIAGVNQNFGVVNNVYNMGGDPEIVDFRDIQDGLNERFPERIPPRPSPEEAQDVRLLPAPGVPSRTVRAINTTSYVAAVVFAVLAALAFYAVFSYGR